MTNDYLPKSSLQRKLSKGLIKFFKRKPPTKIVPPRSDSFEGSLKRAASNPLFTIIDDNIEQYSDAFKDLWVPAYAHPQVNPADFKSWMSSRWKENEANDDFVLTYSPSLKRNKSFAERHVIFVPPQQIDCIKEIDEKLIDNHYIQNDQYSIQIDGNSIQNDGNYIQIEGNSDSLDSIVKYEIPKSIITKPYIPESETPDESEPSEKVIQLLPETLLSNNNNSNNSKLDKDAKAIHNSKLDNVDKDGKEIYNSKLSKEIHLLEENLDKDGKEIHLLKENSDIVHSSSSSNDLSVIHLSEENLDIVRSFSSLSLSSNDFASKPVDMIRSVSMDSDFHRPTALLKRAGGLRQKGRKDEKSLHPYDNNQTSDNIKNKSIGPLTTRYRFDDILTPISDGITSKKIPINLGFIQSYEKKKSTSSSLTDSTLSKEDIIKSLKKAFESGEKTPTTFSIDETSSFDYLIPKRMVSSLDLPSSPMKIKEDHHHRTSSKKKGWKWIYNFIPGNKSSQDEGGDQRNFLDEDEDINNDFLSTINGGLHQSSRLDLPAEKLVYQVSHIKIAQRFRPLYQQVLISNLMLYIISVHADVTLNRSPKRRPIGVQGKKRRKSMSGLSSPSSSSPTKVVPGRRASPEVSRERTFNYQHLAMIKSMDEELTSSVDGAGAGAGGRGDSFEVVERSNGLVSGLVKLSDSSDSQDPLQQRSSGGDEEDDVPLGLLSYKKN